MSLHMAGRCPEKIKAMVLTSASMFPLEPYISTFRKSKDIDMWEDSLRAKYEKVYGPHLRFQWNKIVDVWLAFKKVPEEFLGMIQCPVLV